MTIVIQAIATPSLERSPGCDCRKVGENSASILPLFDMRFQYEQACAYRKSYGAYLRPNQWTDVEAMVSIIV